MKHPSQEDLLGYVLGALDAQQHREVQQLIDNDPDLEEQLLEIRNSLLPLDLIDAPAGPPVGLARRACEMVAGYQKQEPGADDAFANRPVGLSPAGGSLPPADGSLSPLEPDSVPVLGASDTLFPSSGWSRSDLLVGVAAIAILVGILLPAVSYSRHHSRVVACQENMMHLGRAFLAYSEMNPEGRFVEIPGNGNLGVSGCYAVLLKEAGLIENDEKVSCAGVPKDKPVVIPSRERIENASGDTLKRFQQSMGGDYGYTLGYMENNRYQAPRYEGQANMVLLADRPSRSLPGRQSANHGGQGQNCLFSDGHVEFVQGIAYGEDQIYENDYGWIAVGTNASDSVIAPSNLRPLILDPSKLKLGIGTDEGYQ